MSLLPEHGADLKAVNRKTRLPLCLVVYFDAVWWITHDRPQYRARVLLEAGADTSAVEHMELTPLHGAAEWGDEALRDRLRQAGAGECVRDKRGRIPFGIIGLVGSGKDSDVPHTYL